MFGFGQQKKKNQDMKVDLSKVDLASSNDMRTFTPRYEYTVKLFEEDGNGKVITSIQKGVKANSDKELFELYAMCQQKIQILEKREINPNALDFEEKSDNSQISSTFFIQPQKSACQPPALKPIVKYFSAGGLDFKIVGQDVFQKQWIRATEEESSNIRIVSDMTNKIMPLKDKHLEIQHWIKVEDDKEETIDKV